VDKVIIEFHKDSSEDVKRVTSADSCYLALDDFREWLRSEYKYKDHPEEVQDFIEAARSYLYEVFQERNATIWLG